jgi:hypothetical protein
MTIDATGLVEALFGGGPQAAGRVLLHTARMEAAGRSFYGRAAISEWLGAQRLDAGALALHSGPNDIAFLVSGGSSIKAGWLEHQDGLVHRLHLIAPFDRGAGPLPVRVDVGMDVLRSQLILPASEVDSAVSSALTVQSLGFLPEAATVCRRLVNSSDSGEVARLRVDGRCTIEGGARLPVQIAALVFGDQVFLDEAGLETRRLSPWSPRA